MSISAFTTSYDEYTSVPKHFCLYNSGEVDSKCELIKSRKVYLLDVVSQLFKIKHEYNAMSVIPPVKYMNLFYYHSATSRFYVNKTFNEMYLKYNNKYFEYCGVDDNTTLSSKSKGTSKVNNINKKRNRVNIDYSICAYCAAPKKIKLYTDRHSKYCDKCRNGVAFTNDQ
jgi:hypothetical protein